MKITLNVSDELLAQAMKETGIKGKTELINHALKEIVAAASRKHLAAMFGSDKKASVAPRRRG